MTDVCLEPTRQEVGYIDDCRDPRVRATDLVIGCLVVDISPVVRQSTLHHRPHEEPVLEACPLTQRAVPLGAVERQGHGLSETHMFAVAIVVAQIERHGDIRQFDSKDGRELGDDLLERRTTQGPVRRGCVPVGILEVEHSDPGTIGHGGCLVELGLPGARHAHVGEVLRF